MHFKEACSAKWQEDDLHQMQQQPQVRITHYQIIVVTYQVWQVVTTQATWCMLDYIEGYSGGTQLMLVQEYSQLRDSP